MMTVIANEHPFLYRHLGVSHQDRLFNRNGCRGNRYEKIWWIKTLKGKARRNFSILLVAMAERPIEVCLCTI